MRAWDIPGWNTGAKIRRKSWDSGAYSCIGGSGTWVNCTRAVSWKDMSNDLLQRDDWELLPEPKKKVKVKMYCPIYKSVSGRLWVGAAQSDKNVNSLGTCVGWQETEIEYEEI